MKILVTGGAGFIGSHLCKKLINDNNTVVCVDNFSTGNISNIKELLENKNFIFIEHDVTIPFDIDEVDQIYNLACPASPVHYQNNPVKTIETNILGTINVLNIARKNKARILQASTSEVYGDPAQHPQSENYWGNVNPIGMRACYDEGKRVAETLFFDYHRQYGVDIKVIRIFNTYGPNMQQNDGRVISNFIIQAINNSDITIYGDGKQTRSFCYVDDLIEGMISFMNNSSDMTGPLNIGNPCEITINDLAELIVSLTNSYSKIINFSAQEDDPKKRKPDISLANNILNWEPKIDLQEGLKKTIEYFMKEK